MTARSIGWLTTLVAIVVVLAAATPAAAHGVDVSAELVRTSLDGSVDRAPLRKPLPPESETALAEASDSTDGDAETADDGPNVALVFAIGAAAGLVLTVIRKRLASKKRP